MNRFNIFFIRNRCSEGLCWIESCWSGLWGCGLFLSLCLNLIRSYFAWYH